MFKMVTLGHMCLLLQLKRKQEQQHGAPIKCGREWPGGDHGVGTESPCRVAGATLGWVGKGKSKQSWMKCPTGAA